MSHVSILSGLQRLHHTTLQRDRERARVGVEWVVVACTTQIGMQWRGAMRGASRPRPRPHRPRPHHRRSKKEDIDLCTFSDPLQFSISKMKTYPT